MKEKKFRRKKNFMYVFLVCFTLAFIVYICLDTLFRPHLVAYAESKVKNSVSATVEEALAQTVRESGLTYGDMAVITKNTDGYITAIETNTMNISLLKSSAVKKVSAALKEYDSEELKVPLGTLLGWWQYMAGRGPDIPFHILPGGSATADIKNSFTSAGINQTKHEITITISVDVAILFPMYTATVHVTADFIVADTVIVGQVPQTYLDLQKGERDILGKPNDYAIND